MPDYHLLAKEHAERDEWKGRALAAEAAVALATEKLQSVIVLDGGAELLSWEQTHRLYHRDEPYVGCVFCRPQFCEVVERDKLAEQLKQAREVIANLRTAAREVGEFFDFASPGLSEFAGLNLETVEGDPTGALLSLHDYANDADNFLAGQIDSGGE